MHIFIQKYSNIFEYPNIRYTLILSQFSSVHKFPNSIVTVVTVITVLPVVTVVTLFSPRSEIYKSGIKYFKRIGYLGLFGEVRLELKHITI